MNLSECLLYRDISELGEMASFYNCECNRNSKLELVQSIHHRMLNRKVFTDVLKQMDKELLYFSIYILFQSKSLFSIYELVAKGKYVCSLFDIETSPQTWIKELLKKGWLFPISSKFQIQLGVPADFHSIIKKELKQYWLEKHKLFLDENMEVKGIRDEQNAIILDIQIFLEYIRKTLPPLTVEGVIYKRYQQQIMQKFHVKEELINQRNWRFGYGRRFPFYPNRFALIYDYCFEQGWIKEEDGVLIVTPQGESISLLPQKNRELTDIQDDLILFWLKTYKKPIPSLPFILSFLREIIGDQWLKTKQVYDLFLPWIEEYYFDDKPTIFKERIIQMLIHLGIVNISTDSEYIILKNSL